MTNRTIYTYLRDPADHRRVLTIGRTYDKEAGTVSYATAVCNPLDQFKKAHGRLVVDHKLKGCPTTFTISKNVNLMILDQVVMEIAASTELLHTSFLRRILEDYFEARLGDDMQSDRHLRTLVKYSDFANLMDPYVRTLT